MIHTVRGGFRRDETIKVVLDEYPDLFRTCVYGRLELVYAGSHVLVSCVGMDNPRTLWSRTTFRLT